MLQNLIDFHHSDIETWCFHYKHVCSRLLGDSVKMKNNTEEVITPVCSFRSIDAPAERRSLQLPLRISAREDSRFAPNTCLRDLEKMTDLGS